MKDGTQTTEGDGGVSIPSDVDLHQIEQWSSRKPDAISLLHKRRGCWRAFRWRDVRGEVDRPRVGLRRRGFAVASRLAVSGAAPSLRIDKTPDVRSKLRDSGAIQP